MKKFLKYTVYTVVTIIVIVLMGVSYIMLGMPNVGKAENITIERTAQRVDRGKYLANSVCSCIDCHSGRDWSKFGGPVLENTIGAGGIKIDAKHKFPGEVYIPNITPYNLKNWTDGELFRVITTGVKKDGSAMFPIMPYAFYSKMSREDVYSIIAYLRTLKAQKTSYPKPKLDFPLNILVNTMPQKANLSEMPNPGDTVKYGGYLVQIGFCKLCHSPGEAKPIVGMEFAGGREMMAWSGGTVRSANITPDPETGIGSWTKAQFVNHFRQYADSTYKGIPVKPGAYQTVMPWYNLGSMKPSDLEAIYAYLRTVKPIKHQFERFKPDAK